MHDAASAALPFPRDARDLSRVEHTRLRRRLLYSEHQGDLEARIRQALGITRADVLGFPDLTANPYLSTWSQIAVLYQEEPDVLGASSGLASLVADAGFWPLMQRVQRDTLALRDMLVHVDVDDAGDLVYRPVFPDMVTACGTPRRPNVAVTLREAMPAPGLGWVWHVRDVSDPENPRYVVEDRNGADVSAEVLGGDFSGSAYPYRDAEGRPFLPYVWYHSAETGWLFDPFTLREIVEGALNIGVLLTYYQHVVRNAAHAQRWTLGVRARGADAVMQQTGVGASGGLIGSDLASTGAQVGRTEVIADPAVVMQFEQDDNASSPQIGQWSPPVDPERLLSSISAYERRILLLAGVQPPDVTRQEADVRSGYSLAVSREAVREAQRQYAPQFRKGDQQMFRIAACLLNRHHGAGYSERASDYRISYQGLPESPMEVKARLEELDAKSRAGMVGPVSAYLSLNPTSTRDEAVVRLAEAATEKVDVEAAVGALLSAKGIVGAPPVVDLDVGKVQAAQQIVTAAASGEMAVSTAHALLVGVIGLTPDAARAITDTIRPAPPVASVGTQENA